MGQTWDLKVFVGVILTLDDSAAAPLFQVGLNELFLLRAVPNHLSSSQTSDCKDNVLLGGQKTNKPGLNGSKKNLNIFH